MNNKGFTMLEMLVCLLIMTSLMLLSLRKIEDLNVDYYYFLNDYLLNQSKALCESTDVSLGKGIDFNSMGRVNQARTIELNKHSIIIHLGNGYVTLK